MKTLIIFLSILTYTTTAAASELVFESGRDRTTMVELFTSEGCNSCPPAEHLLNQYRDDPGLWKQWIPVAWHVDYWDYLGWKDPYSSATYSNRQRHYAQVLRARTVFTPNFVVNGLNWRPGILSARPASANGNAGNLKVSLKNGILSARLVDTQAHTASRQLNVALLGMGLVSDIRAGENAGRKALHEFVVLSHQTVSSSDNHWQLGVKQGKVNGLTPRAIAVWVSRNDDPTPLQATGALLPDGVLAK